MIQRFVKSNSRVSLRFLLILMLAMAWPILAGATTAVPAYEAEPVRFPAATLAEPGGRVLLYFEIKNAGTTTWPPGSVTLSNISSPMGAPAQSTTNRSVLPGETVYWDFEVSAPGTPGIYESAWQIKRGNSVISARISCYVIAVPKEAQVLRDKIQVLIDQFNAEHGHEVTQLIRQISELLAKEGKGAVQKLVDSRCGLAQGMIALFAVTLAVRRRDMK